MRGCRFHSIGAIFLAYKMYPVDDVYGNWKRHKNLTNLNPFVRNECFQTELFIGLFK